MHRDACAVAFPGEIPVGIRSNGDDLYQNRVDGPFAGNHLATTPGKRLC